MKKDLWRSEKEDVALFVHSQRYSSIRFLRFLGLKNVSRASLVEFLRMCVLPLWIGLLLYFPTHYFREYPYKGSLFLLYIGIIAIITTHAGLIAGLFTLGVILAVVLYLFEPLSQDILIQLGFFVLSSCIVAISIDRARKSKEIMRLKLQEKKYAETFMGLNEAFVKARADIKARDEFLSIVSHELKTPLTIMLLKLSQMLNNIRNTSLAKFSVQELMKVLTNAEMQVMRMSKMINDLVNVSLITTGRMDLQLEECNLNQITKTVVQSFSELIKKEKCRVTIEGKDRVVGKWDKVRIEQAITNLLSNAIKYGQNKPIMIKIFISGNTGKLSIQDQGIGIEEKNQEVLFKLFQRSKQATGFKEGLGVGLYVTAQIAQAHGGSIKVSSKPNRGATFTIELPLSPKKGSR